MPRNPMPAVEDLDCAMDQTPVPAATPPNSRLMPTPRESLLNSSPPITTRYAIGTPSSARRKIIRTAPGASRYAVVLGSRFQLRRFLRRPCRLGPFNPDTRLVKKRNLHRRGYETEIVRLLVELGCFLFVAARCESHHGSQRDALEDAAAVRGEKQRADGVVLVSDDVDLAARAERQIAEQMARRQRGDEEVLRVVGVGVAAEHRIGAADDVGLAVDLEAVLATVSLIAGGAGAEVAVPDEVRLVVVRLPAAGCLSHDVSLKVDSISNID